MFDATKEEIDKLRSKGFGMQEAFKHLKIQKLKDANRSSRESFIQQKIIADILTLL